MSEQIDNLRATLEELQEELRSVESLDPETRKVIEEAVDKIESALHDEDVEAMEHQSLIEQFREATEEFEKSHPGLTRIVGNLMDGLGQMGI